LILKIKDFLAAMGMPDIDFIVRLGLFELNKFALEECCFYITTNRGEDLKSLGRVASGGELSRIMMAIKLSINLNTKNKLYLLDEIDAGLSGKEADSIGVIIKSLSLNNQVICITHLPQIASKTNNHYKLFKEVIDGRTYCKYLKLDKSSRINELAEMVSGKDITVESIDFAKGILDNNG
jgi:ATPase involved in DNA repair